jgi:heme-degrading monooxygenase HmoA
VAGFIEFHLLKSPAADDHTLYASHTVRENRALFVVWTKSEAFRAAHNRAEDNKPLYLDHPQYEGSEVRQTVGHGKTAEWQSASCNHHGATDTLDWNKSLSSWLG